MKKLIIIFSFLTVLQSKTEAQYGGGYISFQTFYDQLSPYGIWVNYPEYGGYVWAPNAGRYFKPYGSNGRWVYTHYGWTWVSYYQWGWAPFHYGRWIYDDWRGWLWLPGYDWAPAWVAWGSYGGNYGWAPLGPDINININFGWRPPSQNWWTFVPRNRFGSNNWNNYAIRNNTTIVNNNITIINNVYQDRAGAGRPNATWLRGPEVGQVERETRTRIRPMEITNATNPNADRVNNNKLAIYRPSVDKKPDSRPGRVETFDKLRPVSKLPERDPSNNFNRPTNPRPVNPAPSPRPTQPTNPSPRPINPAPSPRPTHPKPVNPTPAPQPTQPANPSPRPAPRPVNPAPSPRPVHPSPRPAQQVNRPVNPSPRPAPQPSARPAEKKEARPSPRRGNE
ncbi:MAG: hypothetical protein QM802_18785 [Agriterribacter sp.]